MPHASEKWARAFGATKDSFLLLFLVKALDVAEDYAAFKFTLNYEAMRLRNIHVKVRNLVTLGLSKISTITRY